MKGFLRYYIFFGSAFVVAANLYVIYYLWQHRGSLPQVHTAAELLMF